MARRVSLAPPPAAVSPTLTDYGTHVADNIAAQPDASGNTNVVGATEITLGLYYVDELGTDLWAGTDAAMDAAGDPVTINLYWTILLTTPSVNKRKMKQRETAMDVTLPADLRAQVDQELASGHYQSSDDLIGQAIRHFLDERQRGQRRLDALRRIGQAVDQAGLYERVLIPGRE